MVKIISTLCTFIIYRHDGLKRHGSRRIKAVPAQNKATSNPRSFEKLKMEYASQTT